MRQRDRLESDVSGSCCVDDDDGIIVTDSYGVKEVWAMGEVPVDGEITEC